MCWLLNVKELILKIDDIEKNVITLVSYYRKISYSLLTESNNFIYISIKNTPCVKIVQNSGENFSHDISDKSIEETFKIKEIRQNKDNSRFKIIEEQEFSKNFFYLNQFKYF